MHKFISLTLLASLVLATPARAQIQGSAQASGLHYTLSDLDPGDGIAPSATFAPGPSVTLSAEITNLVPGVEPFQRLRDITVTAPASLAPAWAPEVRMSAVYDAGGVYARAAVDPIETDYALAQGLTSGELVPWFFQLAPHTSISFSLDVAVALSMVEGGIPVENGGASAFMSLYYRTEGGFWSSPIYDGVFGSIGTDQNGHYVPSVDLARTATVSWANDSDAWIEGQVQYHAGVNVGVQYGEPPPVPEPQGWAMLLAGAGLLAAVGRKKSPPGRGLDLRPKP